MHKMIVCLWAVMMVVPPAWAQDELRVQAARKKVVLSGYTRSRAVQIMACEVPGKVTRVNYDVGQVVGAQPFVEIDPTFVDFQIEQAQWTLEKLEVVRARGASRLAYLQKEFERVDALHQGSVAPLSRLEGAAEELDQAKSAVQTTEVEIKALKTQLKELRERRRRHAVTAPAGWVIVHRQVEPGEIVAAGTPLGQAADFTKLVVPLFVSGEELAVLQQSEILAVQVNGRPGSARINWVNPQFDERTRKLAVELELVAHEGEVRGGLLTELALEVESRGLMLPKKAVVDRYDNPYVVVKGGPRVQIVPLGESGDNLIIADQSALSPGTELEAAPVVPAPMR